VTNKHRQDVPDGQFHHRITRTVEGISLGFEWHGGAYIEVCKGQAFKSPKEVINVWDCRADGPTIPRTVEAMEARVDEWIQEYGEYGPEDLAHDVRENWQ
jgi:hypothetical protein